MTNFGIKLIKKKNGLSYGKFEFEIKQKRFKVNNLHQIAKYERMVLWYRLWCELPEIKLSLRVFFIGRIRFRSQIKSIVSAL